MSNNKSWSLQEVRCWHIGDGVYDFAFPGYLWSEYEPVRKWLAGGLQKMRSAYRWRLTADGLPLTVKPIAALSLVVCIHWCALYIFIKIGRMARNQTKITDASGRIRRIFLPIPRSKEKDSYELIHAGIHRLWTKDVGDPRLLGFGVYHYKSDRRQEGDSILVGFSPRKAASILYLYGWWSWIIV